MAPVAFACRVSSIASRVELEPVPAMTARRPRAASTTIPTTRRCSSWDSVGDSPVVPHGTTPSVPLATWNSTSSRSFASSTSPSLNGVTSATIEPWNIDFIERSRRGNPALQGGEQRRSLW